MINEVLPNPLEGDDWVELYNPTEEEVSLNGWELDDEGTATIMFPIKEATISAKGFLAFEVGSRLNKDGDTVYLKNNVETMVDEFGYDKDPGSGVSFGRTPDGGDWGICQQPTKGSTNQCLIPSPTPTATSIPPTPVPTAAPTHTPPTSTPTLKPTATPTKVPTLSPTPTEEMGGEILGEIGSLTTSPTPTTSESKTEAKSKSALILPVLAIIIGGSFIGFAFYLWRQHQGVFDSVES